MTAQQMELLLEQAARAAGLPDAATLEESEDAYQAWACTPLPALADRSPVAVAAGLPLAALLNTVEASARQRGPGLSPSRIWVDEVVHRLQTEQTATGGDGPVLGAVAELALREPEAPAEDWASTRAGLAVLLRWASPAGIPVLLSALAVEGPDLRQQVAEAIGRFGHAAWPAIRERLSRTRDPALRGALLTALCHMPRDPRITAELQTAWQQASAAERPPLARSIARYGDPALAPEIAAAMAEAPTRTHWAVFRVSLVQLGATVPAETPPAPAPADAVADLVQGAETLAAGACTDLAREWVRDALERLTEQDHRDPGDVDWLLFERAHLLADRLLARSPELALHRFTDYCFGALHYYGALPLQQLLALVAMTGATPPAQDLLWTAVTADERFRARAGRVVTLGELHDADRVLSRRAETGLQPALFSLDQFALTAREMAHLAWSAGEADAAEALMSLLPATLARPERVVALQMALRTAPASPGGLQEWLSHASGHGLQSDDRLKDAIHQLWQETPGWELFGHSPRVASELLALAQAQVGPDDPCPCGSDQPFRQCCGKENASP